MMSVPKTWVTASGHDLFTLVRGVSYEKSEASNVPAPGLVPILRANNISGGQIVADEFVYVPSRRVSPEQYLRQGDLLIAASSGSRNIVGKAAKVDGGLGTFAFGAFCVVARPKRAELSSWLYSYMRSAAYRDYVERVALGININNLRTSDLKSMPVQVAPLQEQQRVVAKIESLSLKSRRARDQLKAIPRLVEQYKQAILAAVFRGDLGATFSEVAVLDKLLIDRQRSTLAEELGARPWKVTAPATSPRASRSGKWMRIGDICVHRSGIAFKSGTFSKSGTPVVRLGNLYNGVFDLSRNPAFIEKDAVPAGAFMASGGDILVSLTGTKYKRDYGRLVQLPEGSKPVYVNQRVLCLSCVPSVNPRWLVYFSQTPMFMDFFFSHETGGVNQGNVGVAGVMNAPIPVPPLTAQEEIIGRLDSAFRWVNRAITNVKNSSLLLDHLDEAILRKAFRGELVPQDPRDEPPDVLFSKE
ncbi:restriction endonuclease subunit S [uncultured Bradyrhizobium sp.]|jgi:type I restriction enzyme S subunit|uniref:restriction endonuclease subunit S n=1 Tax=uncultured Bradyrhizobium sp. TaxID=199684 RepID=UPI002623B587|nr:restriction endonuclease subunit S [uncultured Bradyrhizobium sp.]